MSNTVSFAASPKIFSAVEPAPHLGIENLLGRRAWHRLPAAVRARFAEPAQPVDYIGVFEEVRASALGRVLAVFCRLLGTPVAPRTGRDVPAIVRVSPTADGAAWHRKYRWPTGGSCWVRSVKMVDVEGALVEKLPGRLCMPLEVFERGGALHFVSRGYYFELFRVNDRALKVHLPRWLSPGVTHVVHADEGGGWFRFSMSVNHPLFGELFHQTGRFHAAGG